MHAVGELPQLKATLRLGGKDSNVTTRLFDANFYPYTPAGLDPVFAVTGGQDTYICRPVLEKGNAVEILRWFKDEDANANLNSLVWSQDPETGDPLICIVGESPKIKVLNVITGSLVKTLVGHGDFVNDLAVSPTSPSVIASASMDRSIRIWSLETRNERCPCSVICAGAGHKEGILAVAFHRSGRYLLSGGLDTIVNLWSIPELPSEGPNTDDVTLIHYPHFSTTEVHTDFVDCVRFYDDLILSRAAKENKIVLWKIDGFSSLDPVPAVSSAPATTSFTASTSSAFGGRFQRLLQFDTSRCTLFYERFALFHEPGLRPILVAGNELSQILWWDLQSLEEDQLAVTATGRASSQALSSRVTEQSAEVAQVSLTKRSLEDGTTRSDVRSKLTNSSDLRRRHKAMSDPFGLMAPHKVIPITKVPFNARQFSWSKDGQWCVAAGDNGLICVFHRNRPAN